MLASLEEASAHKSARTHTATFWFPLILTFDPKNMGFQDSLWNIFVSFGGPSWSNLSALFMLCYWTSLYWCAVVWRSRSRSPRKSRRSRSRSPGRHKHKKSRHSWRVDTSAKLNDFLYDKLWCSPVHEVYCGWRLNEANTSLHLLLAPPIFMWIGPVSNWSLSMCVGWKFNSVV